MKIRTAERFPFRMAKNEYKKAIPYSKGNKNIMLSDSNLFAIIQYLFFLSEESVFYSF